MGINLKNKKTNRFIKFNTCIIKHQLELLDCFCQDRANEFRKIPCSTFCSKFLMGLLHQLLIKWQN